jgi:acyl dehydratase
VSTAVTILHGPDELRAAQGRHLGHSGWLTIDQQRIDRFAEATGTPAAVADGYLTLSLSNFLLPQIVEVTGFAMGVNYGADQVRFLEPVEAGSRIRAGAELTAVADVAGGLQTTMTITIEAGSETGDPTAAQPVCVIESVSRWMH